MEARFETFTRQITSIYRSIQKIKSVEMTSFGLKGVHVLCTYFLSKHEEGLTSAQLCDMCGEDKGAISRAVSALKEKGYVTETQPDEIKKYRSIITLTDSGREVAKYETEKICDVLEKGGCGLSEEKRKSVYESLTLICKNLEQYINGLDDESR